MFIEVAREQMGVIERAHRERLLVDRLMSISLTRSERLHIARLSIECGYPIDIRELAACSAHAHRLGDTGLAERLARAAVDNGGGASAQLLLARTISAQGRSSEADETLAAIDPDLLDGFDLVVYIIAAASNRLVFADDAPGASAILDRLSPRVTDPQLQLLVSAQRAVIALSIGEVSTGLALAEDLLAHPSASIWSNGTAGAVAGEALYQLGRSEESKVRSAATLAIVRGIDPMLSVAVHTTIVQNLVAAGGLADARAWSAEFFDATTGLTMEQAAACYAGTTVAIATGALDEAERFGVSSKDTYDRDDHSGIHCATTYLLTLTRAYRGDRAGAVEMAEECLRLVGTGPNGCAVFGDLSIAFARFAGGEITRPIADARRAAERAISEGRVVYGITALHWALRFGDLTAAEPLRALCSRHDGVLPAVLAGVASATIGRDPVEMARLASELEKLGYLPMAADAYADATAWMSRSSDDHAARQLRSRVLTLAARCGGLRTPAIAAAMLPDLTRRELEIVSMFACGLPNHVIADELGLAHTTVRAHLNRARDKYDNGSFEWPK